MECDNDYRDQSQRRLQADQWEACWDARWSALVRDGLPLTPINPVFRERGPFDPGHRGQKW